MSIYISCGSNLGDRVANINRALGKLEESGEVGIVRRSRFYETSPVDFTDQPFFINNVIEVQTALEPEGVLRKTKWVESLYNTEPRLPKGPRVIDLDIVMYNDEIVDTSDLQLPHPQMCRRKFVLVPLLEISPGVFCPVDKRPLTECLDCLNDPSQTVEVHHG